MSDQFIRFNKRQSLAGRVAKLQSEVKELWADCEQLKQEKTELETALKRLEWLGYRTHDLRQCPVCFSLKREGIHGNDCFIAKALYPDWYPATQESSTEKEPNHA